VVTAEALLALGVVVTIAFAVIGLARGWRREAWTLGALVVVWLLALVANGAVVSLVNGAGRLLGFVLAGGLAARDSDAIWRDLAARPLVDPARPELLIAALFAVAVVASYIAPAARVGREPRFGDRFVGLAMGCVNGYLVACALLKYGVPTALGTGARVAADLFGRFAALALVVAIAVLAVYAWLNLRHARPSTSRRASPQRAPARASSRRRRPRQS